MRAKLGSASRPLENGEMVTLARAFLQEEGTTVGGKRGLWWWGGNWWVWVGGQWVVRETEDVEATAMLWLEDVWVDEGKGGVGKVECTRQRCVDLVWALRSLVKAPWTQVPVWTERREERPDPRRCVAFRDKVVYVGKGGRWEVERDETWFSPVVVPCEWDPEAKCERWMRCLEQWGQGDERWGKLAQRWFGYCLMAHREYRKWMLLQGKTGGGKGVNCAVLKALLGQGYTARDMEAMAARFGLTGVQYVNVVSVTEVVNLEGGRGRTFSGVAKRLVGGDPVTVEEKYEKAAKDVSQHAALMMSSNPVPQMENENEGMSAKMLILPFQVSFDKGGGEVGLVGRLVGEELQGIAAWAVKGAMELEASEEKERWPQPDASGEVRKVFTLSNNPLDQFLETFFVVDPEGFVPGYLVRQKWEQFKMKHPKAGNYGNMLLQELVTKGTWPIVKHRKGSGGDRGLRGLRLRRDEVEEL